MVETVNIHEAKTHLSRLLEQVSGGQEVVIAKSGKPIARLVPIQSKAISLGFLKGKLHAAKILIESRGKPRHSCRGRIARTAKPSWNFDIQ